MAFSSQRVVFSSLVGLTVALLVVGVVSGTLLRHVVQIGHYTLIEVVSTAFMAGFSLAGVVKSIPLGRTLRPIGRALVVILFAVLQVAAMWVSFLKPIANR